MVIKGVLFDLDGVLVDGADWHRDALNQALMLAGCEPISQEDHVRDYNGLSTKAKLRRLVDRGWLDERQALGVYATKQKLTSEAIEAHCRPDPRVTAAVAYAASNFRVAVVTNCIRASAFRMLICSGLGGFFNQVITNEDVDGLIKPHPRPYEIAAARLCLSTRECLAIEDSPRGIESAAKAGCRVWTLKPFEDLTVDNLKLCCS